MQTISCDKAYNKMEDLKNDLVELNKQGVDIVQSDVVSALDRFEMSDDEIDQFYNWTSSVGIDLIDESEEEEELEDDDYLASESDDEEEDEDSEKNIVINYEQASAYTKVNDPVKMYLKEIGRVPLLKADEEVEIAKRIENGIANPDDPKAVADGVEEKNELISANLRLVVAIAKKYTGRGLSLMDLLHEGTAALVKAADRFDYTKGYRFSSYGTWMVHNDIARAIRDFARFHDPLFTREFYTKATKIKGDLINSLGREPENEEISERIGVTAEGIEKIDALFSREKESLFKDLDSSSEDSDDLKPLKLTDLEAKIIRLRFGLEDGRNRTIDEIAEELHISKELAQTIENKAIHKIEKM